MPAPDDAKLERIYKAADAYCEWQAGYEAVSVAAANAYDDPDSFLQDDAESARGRVLEALKDLEAACES
jgi:hypothetical protein